MPSQRLVEAAKANEPQKTFEELIPEDFQDFQDVFSKDSFDQLPQQKPWDHHIEFKEGTQHPPPAKLLPLSPSEQKELDDFLKENLASGHIHPSKSPMATPVFIVKKKDGGFWLVQDYQKLNDITVKNEYPLPLISNVINRLWGAKVFGKLDLRWGFQNIWMAEGEEWKVAFQTNQGLFKPLVMFFRLCNSPGTFQTMINNILQEWIDNGVCIVYLDDILSFAKTQEEYIHGVQGILQTLWENNLFLKPEKCEFI
jgi:Reverse transcriptase (RNA-dependent DNA polymerase)